MTLDTTDKVIDIYTDGACKGILFGPLLFT